MVGSTSHVSCVIATQEKGGNTFEVTGLILSQINLLEFNGSVGRVLLPGRGLDRSGPANGFGGSIEKLKQRLASTETGINKLQQRDAETKTVQTGQVCSLQRADRLDIVFSGKLLGDLGSNTGQFKGADTTQIIDQKHKLVAGLTGHPGTVRIVVVEELEEHSFDERR